MTTSTERSLTLKGGEEPSLVLYAVYDVFYSEFAQDLPPKLFFFKSVLDNWFCDNSTLIIRPNDETEFFGHLRREMFGSCKFNWKVAQIHDCGFMPSF